MRTRPPEPPESETTPRLAYSQAQARARIRRAGDQELLLALRDGDELALDELMHRKTQPLLQMAGRMLGDVEEARDVVQMAFVRIWQNRNKYDCRYSPNTWIYRITSNLAIDHLRSRRSRERLAEPLRHHVRGGGLGGASGELIEMHRREVERIFSDLAATLPHKQRLVFVLRELEGLSSREVAEIAGCRESTVRNHLFNARKQLRQALCSRFPEYAAARRVDRSKGS